MSPNWGEGFYSGYVRVYTPERVLAEYEAVRARLAEFWFWDDGDEVAGPDDLAESVVLADTVDGDEVFAHPASGRLLVLPRNEEGIYVFGYDLREVLSWLTTAGVLTAPLPEPQTFETMDGQRRVLLTGEPGLSLQKVAAVLAILAGGAWCEVDTTSEDPSVVQYLPALGGYATVSGEGEDLWVSLAASASAPQREVDVVLATLVDAGLVAPAGE